MPSSKASQKNFSKVPTDELNPYQRMLTHIPVKKINETDDYFDRLREDFNSLKSQDMAAINRALFSCMKDAKEKQSGDISSDDCVENATVFQFLLYK